MPPEFTFDENATRTRFSDTQLLAFLREFASTRDNRPFRMQDFDAWPERRCTPQTIMLRFRGWMRALTAAGIQGARRGRYSREQLMDILEQAWRQLERPPGNRTLRIVANICTNPYKREWGSLKNACRKLAQFHRGEISRKQLTARDPRGRRWRTLPPLSTRTRYLVFERDSHRCSICGKRGADPAVRLEVDHITPLSKGGTHAMGNLRTLCYECNRGKGGLKEGKRRPGRPRKVP
jgi:5-methylcytosine-specific restriction endonuclease McrA